MAVVTASPDDVALSLMRCLPKATDLMKVRLIFGGRVLLPFDNLASVGLQDGSEVDVLILNTQFVATASENGLAKVWNPESGEEVQTLSHSSGVRSVGFSPDAKHLVTSSRGFARIWDWQCGQSRHTLSELAPCVNVLCAVFSSSGEFLASVSQDEEASHERNRTINQSIASPIRLWRTQSGDCFRELTGHMGTVWAVCFAPSDEQLLVSVSSDRSAKVWDVEAGCCLRTLRGHNDVVLAVDFSRDGSTVVTGSLDGTARLWSVAPVTASARSPVGLQGHVGAVLAVAFPGGSDALAVTGSDDGTAGIWRCGTGELLRQLYGHGGPVLSVALSWLGETVMTGSSDGDAKLWDAESGTCRRVLCCGDDVWSVAFAPA